MCYMTIKEYPLVLFRRHKNVQSKAMIRTLLGCNSLCFDVDQSMRRIKQVLTGLNVGRIVGLGHMLLTLDMLKRMVRKLSLIQEVR